MKTSDEIDDLVNEYFPLCSQKASAWWWIDPHDALSIAMQGLLNAARLFDTRKAGGHTFETFARFKIECSMREWLRFQTAAKRKHDRHTSLQFCILNGRSITEVVADENQRTPLQTLEEAELLSEVEDSLSDREREFLNLRFKIGLTLREVGERLGVTESRACQIGTSIVSKLASIAPGTQ